MALPALTRRSKAATVVVKESRDEGLYIVSDPRTTVRREGVLGIKDVKDGLPPLVAVDVVSVDQAPDMRLSSIPALLRCWLNPAVSSGVTLRYPVGAYEGDSGWRGFGSSGEKKGDVNGGSKEV